MCACEKRAYHGCECVKREIDDFAKWLSEHDRQVIDNFVNAYINDDYDCDSNCSDKDGELDVFGCIKFFQKRYLADQLN